MATLLQSERVKYRCSCDSWFPFCKLFFCRHCAEFRCAECAMEETDLVFCPTCLENTSSTEARQRRHRCLNCYQCPICEMNLVTKAVGENTYLMCGICRWSTKESDIAEMPTHANWPVYDIENNLRQELEAVQEKMRNMAAAEKAQRDQAKISKRRSDTYKSSHLTDRYGLQKALQMRKKFTEKPTAIAPEHEPTEVEEFDIRAFLSADSEQSQPSMDSIIRQPLASGRSLRPVRTPMNVRKSVRCRKCDHNIVKLEFGPCAYKYKVGFFARTTVPEIRLSREPEIVYGDSSVVFLTVYNFSENKCDVEISPDEEGEGPKILSPPMKLSLPPADDTADLMEPLSNVTAVESEAGIVFQRRHRVGIRMEVLVPNSTSTILGLTLKYRHELSSATTDTTSPERIAHLKVALVKNESAINT